jgi:hypothetical protein
MIKQSCMFRPRREHLVKTDGENFNRSQIQRALIQREYFLLKDKLHHTKLK